MRVMSEKQHNGHVQKSAYSKEELLDCGYGRMFGPGNARLPVGNMLMLDRITKINDDGGEHGKGEVVAELDIHPVDSYLVSHQIRCDIFCIFVHFHTSKGHYG